MELDDLMAAKERGDPEALGKLAALRDRAAYTHLTGSIADHLRLYFATMLRQATDLARRGPPGGGPRVAEGPFPLRPDVARALDIEAHPMVVGARRLQEQGYRVAFRRRAEGGPWASRPFSRVHLVRKDRDGETVRTVRLDGTVVDGWAVGPRLAPGRVRG